MHFDIRIVASPEDRDMTEARLREIFEITLKWVNSRYYLDSRIQKCKVQKPRIRPRKKERKEF